MGAHKKLAHLIFLAVSCSISLLTRGVCKLIGAEMAFMMSPIEPACFFDDEELPPCGMGCLFLLSEQWAAWMGIKAVKDEKMSPSLMSSS